MISRLVEGDTDILRMSPADLRDENANHAQEYATVGRSETLDLLRTNGDEFERSLQRIDSDALLERTAEIFNGNELSVAFLIQEVVIDHCDNHASSIRATIAG